MSFSQPLLSTAGSNNIHEEYEELMKGTVPCPTCRGSGRVPKDHPTEQSLGSTQENSQENSQETTQLLSELDKEVFVRIRGELKDMKISQETFSAVSIGRTQGYLSDLLCRGEAGKMPDGKTTIQNLLTIQQFLDKPAQERYRLYREHKMESKDQRRMRREYYEETDEPSFKKRRVITAHAKATMMKFFNEVSKKPDKMALQSISEVLNLDPDVISRFFEKERKVVKEKISDRADSLPCVEDDKTENSTGVPQDVLMTEENQSPIVIFASAQGMEELQHTVASTGVVEQEAEMAEGGSKP